MNAPTPKWFWGVSLAGLAWNLLGVIAFFVQMTMDLSTLPEAQREFYEQMPGWATAAFAAAVFGGALGCIGLLLRKSWAVIVLAVSVLGIAVQASHSIFIGNGVEVFGAQGLAMPIITFGIGVALVVFGRYAATRGWLDSYAPA